MLAIALTYRGRSPLVPFQTLNANPDLVERESEIVGQAGRLGVVTVATNMAGRGTDILLGGNAAVMARIRVRDALAKELLDEEELAVVPKVRLVIKVSLCIAG